MSKFPDPIALPEEVVQARHLRYTHVLRSAKQGILARGVIVVLTLAFALVTNSASLFMDALATLVDIASSAVLLISIKLASRPPDEDHPFGHGKYEPLAGLQLGLFLVFLGGGMFFYHLFALARPDRGVSFVSFLWAVPLFSCILLEICYKRLKKTAEKEHSPALAADAIHYRIDSITSMIAAVALLLSDYLPLSSFSFDHAGAVGISIFMVILGLLAMQKNIDQVVGGLPESTFLKRVKKAALKTAGVLGTEKIRMQLYGPDAHIDIDIEVDPLLTVEKAHAISQRVRVEIQKEIPLARDVIVHIEPYYPNDHEGD